MTVREVRSDQVTGARCERPTARGYGMVGALSVLVAASCGERARQPARPTPVEAAAPANHLEVIDVGPSCGGVFARPPDCQDLRDDPSEFQVWRGVRDAEQLDLAELTPYRNYLAVTDVEPAGYHFSISYERLVWWTRWTAVAPDGTKLMIEAHPGGVPAAARPVPARIAATASKLEATLRERCGPGAFFLYTGNTRTVTVTETVVDGPMYHKDRRGWQIRYSVPMDPSLSRIVGEVTREGRAFPFLATDAQWIPSPAIDPTAPVFGGAAARKLERRIVQAARRFDARAVPPSRASLVPNIATMLPPGVVSRVHVRAVITLHAPHPGAASQVTMIAPLDLHDAVFGDGTTGEATLDVGATRFRLHARLTPRAPREPFVDPSQPQDPWRQLYRGTLGLHLEDGATTSWIRSYEVDGLIDVDIDSNTAFAPDPIQVRQTDTTAELGPFSWVTIELLGGYPGDPP